MKRLNRTLISQLASALFFAPRLFAAGIAAFSPPSGMPGDTVTLVGEFSPGSSYAVRLGGVAAGGVTVSATSLSFTVPAAAISGTIELVEDGDAQRFPVPFLVSRQISGILTPPAGISALDFRVVGGEGVSRTDAVGAFTTTVSTGKATLLWVYRPGIPSTFLAQVTDSDATVAVDVNSTAIALAASNPLVGFRSSAEMDGVRDGIAAHAEFGALVDVIGNALAGSYDYLDDARLDAPLAALALAAAPTPPVVAALAFKKTAGFPEVRLAELSPGGVPNVFDAKIIPSPQRAGDFLILENARSTARPNTVDWTMELFRISPARFPNGLSDLLELNGHSLIVPANTVPVQNGFERVKLFTTKFNVLGLLADAVFDAVNSSIKGSTGLGLDPPKTNQFRIDRNVDEIYLLQSYSGNIPNGLGFQSIVVATGDPNNQWAFALSGNLLLAALDAASVFADAKSITGIDSGFIADLNLLLAKQLVIYRGQDQLDVGTFLDIAKAVTTSVIKGYYSNLVNGDALAELAPRFAKVVAKSFDILGKISSAAQAVERMTGLAIGSTWAVERTLLIVGNPLRPFITAISPNVGRAGTTVTITGGNFSWDAAELSVVFCDFNSTAGDVVASVPAVITRASPTHIDVTVPDAATYRANFANGTAFLCVTKGADEAFSTGAGENGVFTMPLPPAITGLEPAQLNPPEPPEITAGATISILGERLGPDTVVLLDGSTQLATLQQAEDRVVVIVSPAFQGAHTLTVKVGDESSAAFPFTVVAPSRTPPSMSAGLTIDITTMTMSNAADGQVSLLEAMLIANGGLGRAIEVHVNGEPPDTPREADFISGVDAFGDGSGGGVAVRDVVRWNGGAGVFPIGAALPAIAPGDRFDFGGATLDGSAAPAGADAFVFDNASDARLQDVIIKGFPGEGIRVTNETEGVQISHVTVDGVGGHGIFMDNLCRFNSLTTIELLNLGGTGLNVSGDCAENTFTGFQIDTAGGDGLRVEKSNHNTFADFTIRACGGDGLRLAATAERNVFITALDISETGGAGIRITGAGTRYNLFGEPALSSGQSLRVVPAVRDCAQQGLVIEGGASYNVVVPRSISNCSGGGVLITGAPTVGNTVGHHYRARPNSALTEKLFFTLVADNASHGIVLADGASQTLLTGINLYNNTGDGIRVDGSSSNHLLSLRSGVQDFIEGEDPVAAPGTGASVRLTGGSSNNVVGTVMKVVLFNFGSSGFEVFLNIFANDAGGGVIIEGDSDRNHIYGTHIGDVGFLTYRGRVGGAGVALLGGASENRLGGGSVSDEQLVVGSCAGAAILLDGPATIGNVLAGIEIGKFPTGVDPAQLPAIGIHLRNGTKGNQVGIAGPMDKGGFGVRRQSVAVTGTLGPGLWLEACGGNVGTDLAIHDPNKIHNCHFASCDTGILISDGAKVNYIGGPLRGGPERDGFVPFSETYTGEGNRVASATVAGLRYSNMNLASTLDRNVVRNLSISEGFISPPASLDLGAGPPDGCGVLIDPDCSKVVLGEDVNTGISITNTLVGVYIDSSDGHLLRGLKLSAFGNMATGIAVRGGSQNRIGEPGGGRLLMRFVGAGSLPSQGVALLDSADENTVQSCRIEFGTGTGIRISDSAQNLIGGSGPLMANEILGGGGTGIEIDGERSFANRVQGNFIGIARDGTLADPVNGSFANAGDGIQVLGAASGNLIGGLYEPGKAGADLPPQPTQIPVPAPNTITQSGAAGVAVVGASTAEVQILSNSIYANTAAGIALRGGGNGDIPAPTGSSAAGRAAGTVAASVAAGSKVQIFSDSGGEGEVLIGEATVGAAGSWTAISLAPAPFPMTTATVTDAITGSTSPFGLLAAPPTSFEVMRTDGGAPVARAVPFTTEFVVHRLVLTATGADVRVTGLTFAASGGLDDAAAIAEVRLLRDNNTNGTVEASDSVLQEDAVFDADDGEVVFDLLGEVISQSEPQEWLVVYRPGGSPPPDGTGFSLSIAEVGAVDATSFLPAGLDVTPQNAFPVAADLFTVAPPAAGSFDAFIAGVFPGETDAQIIGRLADPDRDGLNNLLEWILGGNPNASDRSRTSPALVEGAGGALLFRFRRREGLPPGTSTAVTVSDLLASFLADATVTGPATTTSNGDGTETLSVRVTRPAGKNQIFLRLEATE